MSYNKSKKKDTGSPNKQTLGSNCPEETIQALDIWAPLSEASSSRTQLFGAQLSSAKLPWNLLKPMLLVQVDYWTEDHWNYDYMQQMNATMPSLNSTLIGVTAVRKHRIYSFYYQNLTR